MSDEKYDATRRAAITPGVALWAAVSFSTGTRLTDEQVERALRSLEGKQLAAHRAALNRSRG